jgi:hypothetical protein
MLAALSPLAAGRFRFLDVVFAGPIETGLTHHTLIRVKFIPWSNAVVF